MGIWPGTSIWSVFQSISKTGCGRWCSIPPVRRRVRLSVQRPDPAAFLSGLSLLRCGAASVSQPFLGVSAGCAFFPRDGQTPRSAHRRGGQRYVPEQRFRQNVKENASYGIILAHCPVHVFHPACSRVEWKEDNMRWSLACLPVVGLAGRRASCWMGGAHVDIPGFPIFFGAVAALLPIILSGGFHMDGFLDATDAIFSRRDRDRKLEIMKDPHCGPFAVLSCAALLLLELGAWGQLVASPLLWPACTACVLSRCAAVAAGSRLPYAKSSTLGVLFAGRAAKAVSIAGWRNMRSGSSF